MKRVFKRMSITMLVLFFMITCIRPAVTYADETELRIYAIYLKNNVKGESLLFESKGEYMLVDIGASSHIQAVIDQLRVLGVNEVSIYFSHLHTDHIAATSSDRAYGLRMINEAGILIKKVYMPDPDLASLSKDYVNRYAQINQYLEGRAEVEYLNVGSTIKIGDATGEVIGPLNSGIRPENYIDKVADDAENDDAMYTAYENNKSLITIFKCGNKKIFAGGDCMEDESKQLVETYGAALDCDVMKLCHHGTGSGNTAALIDAISPEYTFASNTSYTEVSETYGRTLTATASKRASKYGAVYLVGSEQKTLIIQIKNDVIRLYAGDVLEEGKYFSGLTTFKGSDGVKRTTNTYYFTSDGHLATGIQKINGHYFNFGTGGCMEYGSFDSNGQYTGWKTEGDTKRYYALSEDQLYAYMKVGFTRIDGSLYYFDKDGYLVKGVDGEFTVINGGEYAVSDDGEIFIDCWYTDSKGNDYFLQHDGRCYIDQVMDIDGKYYYLNSGGVLYHPAQDFSFLTVKDKQYLALKSGELVSNYMYNTPEGESIYFGENAARVYDSIITYEGNRYYINSSGVVEKGKRLTVDGKTYYFDEYGIMMTDSTVDFGAKTYYFDENGYMVKNQIVDRDGDDYFFNKDGVMVRDKKVTINKSSYYFNETGKMVVSQKLTINGKDYYFNKNGEMIKSGRAKIKGKYYYFDSKGIMVHAKRVKINNKYFYFNPDGTMAKSKKIKINGKIFYFNKDGVMVKDKRVKIEDNYYYFNKSGVMVKNKTITYKDKKYNCDISGVMTRV